MRYPDRVPVTAAIADEVDPAEYARLLGLPRGTRADTNVPGVAAAVMWYREHGRPWAATGTAAVEEIDGAEVRLEIGGRLHSSALARRLAAVAAETLVAVAVSAGPEVVGEAQRRWSDRPEEAYALDRLAAAVTELLLFRAGAALCQAAEPTGRTVLAPLSPGHEGWSVAEQGMVFGMLTRPLPGPLEVLDSGMLVPTASQLAVFGVTATRVEGTTSGPPCRRCSFTPCAYRRAPFSR